MPTEGQDYSRKIPYFVERVEIVPQTGFASDALGRLVRSDASKNVVGGEEHVCDL